MLLILDQDKNYKVVRTSNDQDGGVKRERIGTIPKSSLDLPDELKSAITADELKELLATVDLLREARTTKLKAKVFEFPTLAREITEYVTSTGSEQEQKLVVTAVLESLRLIRKSERNRTVASNI